MENLKYAGSHLTRQLSELKRPLGQGIPVISLGIRDFN